MFAEKVENLPYRCPHSVSTVTISPFDNTGTGNGTGNGNGNSTTAKKYRYSQKMGHMQMECRSRLRDKPLMVNASGQPYKSVNTIKENADMGESTVIVKSISTSGNNLIAPINWN